MMKTLYSLSAAISLLWLFSGETLQAQNTFDAAAVSRELFDESKSSSEREKVIAAHAGKAAEIIADLTNDLPAETSPEEYRRIPWIWRVSIAAGKRNDAMELKELLAVSLPKENEPLRDWQAVVIGGGIINGISLEGGWPGERIAKVIGNDRNLKDRWNRHLEQASVMSDDEKIKIGTRYDALRIIALDSWEKRGAQLMKYMVKGTHPELQQGAVSGLVDVKHEMATAALLAEIEHLPKHNLNFALDGLLRTPQRASALLDAIAAGRVTREMLGEERLSKLRQHLDKKIKARAEKLFPEEIPVLEGDDYFVGAARADITPDYPIRLNGYLARKKESEGVLQKIYAKAIAIGTDREGPALLITVENCGVPEQMRDELARRLKKRGVPFDNIAISASHTHAAPKLVGNADNIFGEDLPADQQGRIERYTRELSDKLEQVSLAALKDRKPSKIHFGQTKADFAANRRTKGGPVDHDLPFLKVIGPDGKTRAVVANYACHCTTMGHEPNEIHGDWAGFAQEYLERDHPGAVALITIGCGADANPFPRPGLDNTKQHGEKIASAIKDFSRKQTLQPLFGRLFSETKRVYLPFATLPTRAEFETLAKQNDPTGYNARKQLARLNRGEKLMTELPYLIQSWHFGTNLAMVFLPGEVVVDYALKIKEEYDSERLWVTAYANDSPCYIPSKRILKEGGYEGGGAIIYYDKPTKLAEPTEEIILSAVRELVPKTFMTPQRLAENPPPIKALETYQTFHRKPGFTVSIVATEPLIVDPVAIDFATDGSLWVLEMHDYPSGMDGNNKPGGRVKLLRDTNGDGEFDKASLFLDDLPFPTGLMQWRKGVIVCAAPDILYAEDTDGDGKADVVKKLFTGFATHNYQARVNSLRWGLDNWIYGSGGLFGGKIKSEITGQEIECSGRDFRMNPDTGAFEPVAGISQQGRARDDFGNWFGGDNSVFLWHFPLPDRYVRRNPHITSPDPRIFAVKDPQPNILFPVSHTMERFNNPNSANRTTSASGVEIYRDNLLGDEFYGNAFNGETVHNVVQRFVLTPDGATFKANRAEDEKDSQFFASTDNWFRPVEIRTGPDGALWIVDMYRLVIEHPRWIPEDRLAKLEVRAGDDKGRIFKTFPVNKSLRPVRDLTKLSGEKLAQMMDTPNGTLRDLIHRELYQRQDRSAASTLKSLASKSQNPAVRVQALCALDGLRRLGPENIVNALEDQDANVRREALRLAEQFLGGNPDRLNELWWNPGLPVIRQKLSELVDDPNYMVRYQLALTLGEWRHPDSGKVLAELARRNVSDLWMRSAILTSAQRDPAQILQAVLSLEEKTSGRTEMVNQLIATGIGGDSKVKQAVITLIAPPEDKPASVNQLAALATLLEALEKNQTSLPVLYKFATPEGRAAIKRIDKAIDAAGDVARDKNVSAAEREAALRIIAAAPDEKDLITLVDYATSGETASLQKTALNALRKQRDPNLPNLIVPGWKNYLPWVRAQLLEFLLAREEGAEAVLQAVERGTISPAEISLNARQLLAAHSNARIQKQAKNLFPANEGRQTVLARFLDEVPRLSGNKERGAEFYNQMCANCHTLRGQGIAVGPDLTPIANKSTADFLVGILDPNAVIEPRFIQYNVELKDDRSLSGVISAETATSVTLNQIGGAKEKILRSDIAEIRASSFSLMPEGLEQGRTAQDFADLIYFIQNAPDSAAPKKESAKIQMDRSKLYEGATNGAAKLIYASEQLDYPSWIGVLPLAHCRQTDGNSKVIWQSEVMPDAIKLDQSYKFRMPAAMGFASQPGGGFQLKVNDKNVLQFDVSLEDKTWKSADNKATLHYQPVEANSEDGSGILTIELHGELVSPGKPVTFEAIASAANSQRWFGIYLLSNSKSPAR